MAREHYTTELEQTKNEFLRMGELAQEAFQAACPATGACNVIRRRHASNIVRFRLSVSASSMCARGSITGMLGAIVDLELIGDYADDLAEIASGLNRKPASGVLAEFAAIGGRVQACAAGSVDR